MIDRLPEWGPIPLRIFLVVLVVPGSQKLLNYGSQVDFFVELGIPAPELLVPLVGVIELTAATLIVFGIAGRLGAALMVPVMLVAMATAEVNAFNTAVLVASLGVLVFGTGRYSVTTERELLDSIRGQTGASGGTATSGENR
jgi:putative oxidoreductase